MPTSRRIGGCTFPEDPVRTCASVLPMWSAAVDPRVLTVRAVPAPGAGSRIFYAHSADVCVLRGINGEHLIIDRGAEPVRLDVIEGTTAAGPVMLRFDLADDDHFDVRIAAARALRCTVSTGHRHIRLARKLLALQAVDAREAGASLREIAEILLGDGEWPGDGEHRKSNVRRLLDTGESLLRAGSREILAEE